MIPGLLPIALLIADPAAQTSPTPPPPQQSTAPEAAPAPDAQTPPARDPSDVTVTGRRGPPPGDPMEAVNVQVYDATQAVDRALVGPIAIGYREVLPKPIRGGLRNALRNLTEPVVFVNDLLQFKPGRAARTFARFVTNSTVGVAGVLDVAASKSINIKYRYNGFGNTLGYHGVRAGPYLYVPVLGPTTARDLFGRIVDIFTLPLTVGFPFNDIRFTAPTASLRSLDYRAEIDEDLRAFRRDNPNPYAARRDQYLQLRKAEIEALHSHRTAPAPDPASPPAKAPER